jgi:hypothetical protein
VRENNAGTETMVLGCVFEGNKGELMSGVSKKVIFGNNVYTRNQIQPSNKWMLRVDITSSAGQGMYLGFNNTYINNHGILRFIKRTTPTSKDKNTAESRGILLEESWENNSVIINHQGHFFFEIVGIGEFNIFNVSMHDFHESILQGVNSGIRIYQTRMNRGEKDILI